MKVEEDFMVDIDISDDPDKSVAMVYKTVGSKVKLSTVFTGKDAENLYLMLTKKGKQDEG